MKVLYIGQYSEGSTSRMRGEYVRRILQGADMNVVNIDVPMEKSSSIFRSIGWRFKMGPMISKINGYIIESLRGDYKYDLVWIDKGIFIKPEIISRLKEKSGRVVHYTPDTAFTYNQSKLFYDALPFYDACITTKSFELQNYQRYGVKTLFCTQGYDPEIHKPYHSTLHKHGVVFVGHREEFREEMVAKIVENGIQISIAGNRWDKFTKKYIGKSNLTYLGKGVYGRSYAETLSSAKLGLGFLSKWFPELHTTRTFEIPACGTALVTERTGEIESIFSENEAIFFDEGSDLIEKLKFFLAHSEELKELCFRGQLRVTAGGYSYLEIMKNIMAQLWDEQELIVASRRISDK